MHVIRSRNGYDESGRLTINMDSTVYDIVEQDTGRLVKEMRGSMLAKMLIRNYGLGRPPMFANVEGARTIIDPDLLKPDVPQFSVSVNNTGKVYCGNPTVASVKQSIRDFGYDFVIEFANGFVIPIHMFTVRSYSSDFSTVSFTLFEHNETFSFKSEFNLTFEVTGYKSDSIRGSVTVQQTFADRPDPSSSLLSEFELTRSGTTYKGDNLPVVYDRAHYSKELLLNS